MTHWWPFLAATVALVVVLVGTLALRGERSGPGAPPPASAAPDGPVQWSPHHYPMGPVSGWPHAMDAPDAVPTGSPVDRPDL